MERKVIITHVIELYLYKEIILTEFHSSRYLLEIFLLQLFLQITSYIFQDKDGSLSPTEMQNLFSTSPVNPWGPDVNNTVCTNSGNWINLNGYLAQWT